MTSSPPLGNSSLTVAHPPFARAASASIQATAPDFIPSIRRSSSDLCDKSADSKVETPANSEHDQKANKVQHKPSKSGPIPESEVSKLQVETGIAGPSRLPSRVSQQMPAPSKSSATVTEVPHTGNVLPSKTQLGSANPHTQTRDQNASSRITSGRLPNQPASVSQAQGQQKKKGTDQKPKNGWSHLRNDPIHGPIRQHHKQPQGSSNTSTHQTSNRDNHHTSPQEPAANSIPQCPNLGKSGYQAVWEPCECNICNKKNRGVRARLGQGTMFTPTKLKAVEDYLRQFGSIEGCSASSKYHHSKLIAYVT